MPNFTPTALCPKYQDHLQNSKPPLAVPDLSDEEIDFYLREVLGDSRGRFQIPRTQMGRRIVVQMWLNRKTDA